MIRSSVQLYVHQSHNTSARSDEMSGLLTYCGLPARYFLREASEEV